MGITSPSWSIVPLEKNMFSYNDLPPNLDFGVSQQSEPGESGFSQELEIYHLSDQSSYDAVSLLEDVDSEPSRWVRETLPPILPFRGLREEHSKSRGKESAC
jgi:hypothetical protein